MKIKMPLKRITIDASLEQLQDGAELYVNSDIHDLLIQNSRQEDMEETIFYLWINCGKDMEGAIMFDVEIDELEEFANALLNKIQIVRNNYSEQIKYQTDRGCNV
jgi:hypothetical protein